MWGSHHVLALTYPSRRCPSARRRCSGPKSGTCNGIDSVRRLWWVFRRFASGHHAGDRLDRYASATRSPRWCSTSMRPRDRTGKPLPPIFSSRSSRPVRRCPTVRAALPQANSRPDLPSSRRNGGAVQRCQGSRLRRPLSPPDAPRSSVRPQNTSWTWLGMQATPN